MGYLFLMLAVLCGAIKGCCGKFTGNITSGFKDASLANTVRMVMCVAVGLVIVICTGATFLLSVMPLLICVMSGVATSFFVVSWLVIVKRGAYMMIDVFLMLGTLVPILFTTAFFGENVAFHQIIGIGIIFAAVAIMCSYNNSIKEKMSLRSFLLLVLCGVSNGFADLSQKLIIKLSPQTSIATFNFYTYLVSAIVLLGFFLFVGGKESRESILRVKKTIPYIVIMSVCLFAYSFLKTVAARYLDSSVLYPLSQGLSLVASSLMSVVIFKERLNAKGITGIVIAIIGMLVLNLF